MLSTAAGIYGRARGVCNARQMVRDTFKRRASFSLASLLRESEPVTKFRRRELRLVFHGCGTPEKRPAAHQRASFLPPGRIRRAAALPVGFAVRWCPYGASRRRGVRSNIKGFREYHMQTSRQTSRNGEHRKCSNVRGIYRRKRIHWTHMMHYLECWEK